jgi:ABC-type transporter Mla maintaining outer membrane lipid asymmetry ATPase subunit MlaF
MVTNDLQRAYQISDQIWFCKSKGLKRLGTPAEVRASSSAEIREFIYSNAFSSTAFSKSSDAKP